MSRSHPRNIHLGPLKIPANAPALLFILIGFAGGYFYSQSQTPDIFSSPTPLPALNVCFSPEGNCEAMAIKAINTAHKNIFVRAYSFTSVPIAQALLDAHNRGVKVELLVDKSQVHGVRSQIQSLSQAGISIKIPQINGIAHDKIIIIDEHLLLAGSYNFSKAANERNSENMLLINDQSLTQTFIKNWQQAEATALPLSRVLSRS